MKCKLIVRLDWTTQAYSKTINSLVREEEFVIQLADYLASETITLEIYKKVSEPVSEEILNAKLVSQAMPMT